MKKFISMLLFVGAMFFVCSCGGDDSPGKKIDSQWRWSVLHQSQVLYILELQDKDGNVLAMDPSDSKKFEFRVAMQSDKYWESKAAAHWSYENGCFLIYDNVFPPYSIKENKLTKDFFFTLMIRSDKILGPAVYKNIKIGCRDIDVDNWRDTFGFKSAESGDFDLVSAEVPQDVVVDEYAKVMVVKLVVRLDAGN